MAKKPPPVSLRKPPAAVDLDRAEAFVRKTEEPKNAQTVKRPEVQTPNGSEAHAAVTPVETAAPPRKHISKSVVARSDGRTLRRMTVYLPDDLARKLAIYCATEDQEMSAVVSEAVRRLLVAGSDE